MKNLNKKIMGIGMTSLVLLSCNVLLPNYNIYITPGLDQRKAGCWNGFLLEFPTPDLQYIAKTEVFVSFFRGLRQDFHRFFFFVANSVLSLINFGKNSRIIIADDKNRHIFASETTKTARLSE